MDRLLLEICFIAKKPHEFAGFIPSNDQ